MVSDYRSSHQATFFVYAYKGRQISEFKDSPRQREFRPSARHGRNDNFRVGFDPTSLSSVLNRGRQISEFFCNVKKMCACCLLRIKG
ncbi:rCG63192 [Rattus norvegicus]|uniref:RCG63192 n=1 Tax=Rattus norvegicus TaxID=10116 RepID=A6K2H2_RAT|nr:rCG63192 [Rattus norvegicus]